MTLTLSARRLLLVAVLFVALAGMSAWLLLRPQTLVYSTCVELSPYFSETAELTGNRFRYWRFSDLVSGAAPPSYPITGTIREQDKKLVFDHPGVAPPLRYAFVANGIRLLFTKKGWDAWTRELRADPYEVMICTNDVKGISRTDLPSIDRIKTQDMLLGEQEEHEQRFKDAPAQLKSLLRAQTVRRGEDPSRTNYKRVLSEARAELSHDTVRGLVGLLGYESRNHVDAYLLLRRLYLRDELIQNAPLFDSSPSEKKRALFLLADSVDAARDGRAIECVVEIFSKAIQAKNVDINVPELGYRLQYDGSTMQSGVSNPVGPEGYRLETEMPRIRPRVRAWCHSFLQN